MASTAQSYRKPPESSSGKSAGRTSPFRLIERVRSSDLHPRRRIVLLAMLEEFNSFAVVDSRNELYPATQTVSVAVGLPYITVRRAIDRLVDDGVLQQVHGSNVVVRTGKGMELRRPCTYQVNEEKLVPRMTLKEHRQRRFGHTFRRQQQSAQTPTEPPQPANPSPSAPIALPQASSPAPTVQPVREKECRTSGRHTYRECAKFVGAVVQFMRGRTSYVSRADGGLRIQIDPESSEYRPPLKRDDAIQAACELFHWTVESAMEAMKFHGFAEPPRDP